MDGICCWVNNNLERVSGKELWSNVEGFPHFSWEAGMELNELSSSLATLDDSPWLLHHSRSCWWDDSHPLTVVFTHWAPILAGLSPQKIASLCLFCSSYWPHLQVLANKMKQKCTVTSWMVLYRYKACCSASFTSACQLEGCWEGQSDSSHHGLGGILKGRIWFSDVQGLPALGSFRWGRNKFLLGKVTLLLGFCYCYSQLNLILTNIEGRSFSQHTNQKKREMVTYVDKRETWGSLGK